MPLTAAPESRAASVPADVPAPPPSSAPITPPTPSVTRAQRGETEPPAPKAPEVVPPLTSPIDVPLAERAAPSTPEAPPGLVPPPTTVLARAASATPRRADPPTEGHGASPLGLGLGRLRIRLDGASVRTTNRETDVISGTLVGGQPERVVVRVDERTSVPTLAGRAFATAVKLSPGINRVRVLATDAQGAEVEEIVVVEYKPPVATDVSITSPRDGDVLGPDDPPLITVQGEVTDPDLSTVWIVANGRRVMAPVTAGRFRYVLPIFEPTVRVRAETEGEDRRSATVTVDATAALPALGLVLGDWPRDTAGPAKMTVMWRPNPAKLDGGTRQLTVREPAAGGEAGGDFFYLRKAPPGVYTFLLTYRAGAAAAVRPVLYVAGASRSLQPVTLDGSGRAVIARLLLPQGVLWEQDDWFTGRSASGDAITKFRFPDGVSWTERLGEVGR